MFTRSWESTCRTYTKKHGLLNINDEYKLSLIKTAWECMRGVSNLNTFINERQGRVGLRSTRRYLTII